MKTRDFFERLWWTFVVAAAANATAAAVFDIDWWEMAAATGIAAVIQAVVVFARWRLSVLPNPGEGLPGLRIEDR